MTLREIFFRLRNQYSKGKITRFPIHLSLRDHQGQDSAVEALERHARGLGFQNPSSLVRAWRGGFADIILDGFDELASSGWSSLSGKLRDIRYANMALVREFARDTPQDSSLVIAGRPSYFDSLRELRNALKSVGFQEVRLGEFTSEQATEFINRRKLTGRVPDWLPARPLLIGYLLSKKSFDDLHSNVAVSEAEGWDYLLDRICAREAEAGKMCKARLFVTLLSALPPSLERAAMV